MTSYADTTTRGHDLGGSAAMAAVAAMIAVLFAGSTALTPLYIIYKQTFGFSQITLTLVYAVYVVGNLGALLMFGRLSDGIGRRPAALASMAVAVVSALVFLLAENVAWLDGTLGGEKTTVPGPLSTLHPTTSEGGVGSSSSEAEPLRIAPLEIETDWSGPASTNGGWFTGGGFTVIVTES